MRLISYNIFHGENPYQKGSRNLDSVGLLIINSSPHFVALQEIDSMTMRTTEFNNNNRLNLMEELAKLTGMKGFFCKAIDYSDGGYGEGILTSEPAIFDCITLPVPEGGEIRSMAIATVLLENGSTFIFAGTHLCHEHMDNRTAQTRAIIEHFASSSHPVVIAGDFNFTTDEPAYDIMNEYFMDAAVEFHAAQNTYPSQDPTIRIDYFWLSRQHKWTLDTIYAIDKNYSDHLPLMIEVYID